MTTRNKFIIVAVILVTSISAFFFGLVLYKDRTYFQSSPYQANSSSDILVVYYSRTGHTEAMAREIARKMNADIRKIETDKYPLTFKGMREAGSDADMEKLPKITPGAIDMSQYRLVFLGSPIWWYRPATPLWSFVEKNDISGKKVVLFNTFNSRFKPEKIDRFRARIGQKGGEMVDHVYIRRGRVYLQKDGNDVISETQELIAERMEKWSRISKD